MDDASINTRLPQDGLNGFVINAGHLNRRNGILDLMLFESFFDMDNHRIEASGVVLNVGGFDQNVSLEVTEHPLGPLPSTINTDNSESLRGDGLNAGGNDSAGLTDNSGWAVAFCGF